MNLTWKKTAAMIVGGLVTASLVAPVLADTTTPTDQTTGTAPGIHQFAPGFHMRGGKGGFMGDLFAGKGGFLGGDRGGKGGAGPMMKLDQGQLLTDAAKGAGLTVEEYKAKLQADRKAAKEQLKAHQDQIFADAAKGAGLAVEEYQAKLQADRQNAMIERYAQQKGITVDEAKAQLKDQMANRMAAQAKRFGITLEDLKAKLGL
ncbi:MAG: hypothetical protein ACM3ZQ_06570 [Bacillota bacterium]